MIISVWIVIVHLSFTHPVLHKHLDIPMTGNPFDGFPTQETCDAVAKTYNDTYGPIDPTGTMQHAYCKQVRLYR